MLGNPSGPSVGASSPSPASEETSSSRTAASASGSRRDGVQLASDGDGNSVTLTRDMMREPERTASATTTLVHVQPDKQSPGTGDRVGSDNRGKGSPVDGEVAIRNDTNTASAQQETPVHECIVLRDEIGPDGDVPRLDSFEVWHRKRSTLAYATFILMCNLAAPCLLYYPLKDHTSLSGHALLGIASATLGISSSFDNPFRMWKLWTRRDQYGPLGDPVRWHLDWTMHLYSFALLPVFATPLAVASSVNPPIYDFFLMSTPMLASVPGIFFLVSLFHPTLAFWMSSDPPGTRMKPGAFYLFEDIGAVDFRHGKQFRRLLHERYHASPIYRDMMWYQTVWWAYGCAVYFGAVAAVTWTTSFDFAFGFILGLLFLWLTLWTLASLAIASFFRKRERQWVEVKRNDPERAKRMTREGADELRRQSKQLQRERRQSERRERHHSFNSQRRVELENPRSRTQSYPHQRTSSRGMQEEDGPHQPQRRHSSDRPLEMQQVASSTILAGGGGRIHLTASPSTSLTIREGVPSGDKGSKANAGQLEVTERTASPDDAP